MNSKLAEIGSDNATNPVPISKNVGEKEVWRDKIINGSALNVLTTVPSGIVDCVVTSPPYFGLRDYGKDGQIGSEESPEDYILSLTRIFREVRRVLKDTGTLWLNLGDKYQDARLLGLPWRVALALQEDGWILRSDIIWHKPNAMPSSVKNRLTTDHEYIFFFVKSSDYFYDADARRR